jgi:DNA-binding transcriptional MerR regulator
MHDLNIQAAAHISGVSVHQIRAWEKRYNAVTPRRLGNNFRSYSNDDIKKLKLLGILINNGIAISKIASMSSDELQAFHDSLNLKEKQNSVLVQSSDNLQKLELLSSFLIVEKIEILKHEVFKFQSLSSITDIIVPLTHKVLLTSNLEDPRVRDLLSTLMKQINQIATKARTELV